MDELLKLFGVIMASGGAGILLYGMFAVVSRLSGGSAPPPSVGQASQEQLDALEDRVAELLPLQERVLELEERLDFAERLLANPDVARPGAGGS